MAKVNGKSEGKNAALDLNRELLDRELPAGARDEEESTITAADSSSPESELQKLKAERDSLLDRLARAQAEFDNARKRASREQQEFRDYAVADAIKSLLPAMDSLERALQVKSDAAELRGGVELIYKQLLAALSKLSVNPISSKGEAFDPRYHEAIEMVETTDVPDHQVLEELQRGYKFKDRLLRPAMVKVSRNSGS